MAIKANGLFFQEKEKRLSESKYSALAESHVPCFQERVGTGHPGYMIPDRLPWRLRARPSATLHEIQVRPTNERQSELVPVMIQTERSAVKRKMRPLEAHVGTAALGCPAAGKYRAAAWGLDRPFRIMTPQEVAPPFPAFLEGGWAWSTGREIGDIRN